MWTGRRATCTRLPHRNQEAMKDRTSLGSTFSRIDMVSLGLVRGGVRVKEMEWKGREGRRGRLLGGKETVESKGSAREEGKRVNG